MLANVILICAGLLLGTLLVCAMPILKNSRAATRHSISVVIPARNEEKNLPLLLTDLKKQTLLPYEVICVDDESDDNTAKTAASHKAIVLKVGERPKGWQGKPWACHSGALKATGELLLFLDADVRLARSALDSLTAEYEKKGRMVSVQPYHAVKKLYEQLSMFFNIILVACTGIGLPFKVKPSGMFGPVLLVSREEYLALGGHEAVKDSVLEDYFLGKHYNKRGTPYTLMLGGEEISFRMYSGGIAGIWEGWTKNFSSGALSIPLPYLIMTALWITAATAAPIGIIKTATVQEPMLLFYVAVYALFILQLLFASRKVGSFWLIACVFYPVFLAGFELIFACSLFMKLILRKVRWKGRDIRV